jgi:hypothetical protein
MSDNNSELPSEGDKNTLKESIGDPEASGVEAEKKRPRGPSDCLNWDDSEEDDFLTCYSQKFESPPRKKMFAKKSSVKKSSAKKSAA